MTKISFPNKQRKDTGLYSGVGDAVVTGKDWAAQNAVDEAREKTRARACFKECRTCGACANSSRDATYPKQFDANAGRSIDCRGCEPYRFHDCHNGLFRDTHQEAEPFTEEVEKIIREQGGRPLI